MTNAKTTTPERATRASVIRNVSITYTPSGWSAGMRSPAIAHRGDWGEAELPFRDGDDEATLGVLPATVCFRYSLRREANARAADDAHPSGTPLHVIRAIRMRDRAERSLRTFRMNMRGHPR